MTSIKTNLWIEQGATYSNTIPLIDVNGNPVNVANCSAVAELRQDYTSTNSVSFDTALANGSLTISLTANATANVLSGRYVYDVNMTNAANVVSRIQEGVVTITPSVTH